MALERSDPVMEPETSSARLQLIQEAMSFMPPAALHEFVMAWQHASSSDDSSATVSLLDEWGMKAQFVISQRSVPVNPEIDMAEWVEFPRDLMSDQ